jgi:hypothetical protein
MEIYDINYVLGNLDDEELHRKDKIKHDDVPNTPIPPPVQFPLTDDPEKETENQTPDEPTSEQNARAAKIKEITAALNDGDAETAFSEMEELGVGGVEMRKLAYEAMEAGIPNYNLSELASVALRFTMPEKLIDKLKPRIFSGIARRLEQDGSNVQLSTWASIVDVIEAFHIKAEELSRFKDDAIGAVSKSIQEETIKGGGLPVTAERIVTAFSFTSNDIAQFRPQIINRIRELRRGGISTDELEEAYGISESDISRPSASAA